jgi:hypothetical protein
MNRKKVWSYLGFYCVLLFSGCSYDHTVSSTLRSQVLPDHGPSPEHSFSPDEFKDNLRGKQWNQEVVPLFGVNVAALPPLESLPARTMGRPETVARKQSVNSSTYLRNARQCYQSYLHEWGDDTRGTQKILNTLRASQKSCWTKVQNKEVYQLQEAIQTNFQEINTILSQPEKQTYEHLEPLLTNLGRNYQEIQEKLSFCRIRDFMRILKSTDSFNLLRYYSDRNLLEVLGDVFGHESGLEDIRQNRTEFLLRSRLAIIDQLREQIDNNDYIVSDEQAYPCASISKDFYHPSEEDRAAPLKDMDKRELKKISDRGHVALTLTSSFLHSLSAFREAFLVEVNKLKINDLFYFVGGATDAVVIYEVMKESDSRYQFRVYNSTRGVKFHASILDGSNQRVFPFVERRNVLKEKMVSFSFLKSLRDLYEQKTSSKVAFIYDNILAELGGIQTTKNVQSEDFLDPQVARDSSYYIFPYRDTSDLGNQALGSHLEFFVKSKMIDVYFNEYPRFSRNEDSARRLAEESLTFYTEELARNISVDPSWKGRYLDRGMVHESGLRVARYREILNNNSKIREQAKNVQCEDLENFSFTPLGRSNSFSLQSILRTPPQPSSDQRQAVDIKKWHPTWEQWDKDMNKFWYNLIPPEEESFEERSREQGRILSVIPEIVRRIPLEKDALSAFLPNIEDLERFLGHLNDLSQLHFWAILTSNLTNLSDHGLSPISILTQVRVLTLADQVMQIYGEKKGDQHFPEFPSLYDCVLDWLVLDHGESQEEIRLKKYWMSYFTIEASWNDSFQEISKYWQKQKDSERTKQPMFQWERYPLYSLSKQEAFQRHILKEVAHGNESHWSRSFGDSRLESFWIDIQWARDFFYQNDIPSQDIKDVLDALQYRYINFFAIRKLPPSPLPGIFFETRDISFVTHYVLSGSFSKEILVKIESIVKPMRERFRREHGERVSRPIDFEVLKEEKEKNLQDHYKNSYKIFGKEFISISSEEAKNLVELDKEVYTGNLLSSLKINTERSLLDPWSKIFEIAKLFFHPHYRKVSSSIPFYRRLSSREIISLPQVLQRIALRNNKEVPVETLEMQRQLLNLGTPIVTLGYFQENAYLLREKRWQILFKSLMFQPGLLLEEFNKTKALPQLLSDFTWNNLQGHLHNQDYLTASFFARMHQLLEEFTIKAEMQDALPRERHARSAFFEILQGLNGASDTKNLVYRDLIRTFQFENFSKLHWNELALFVQAVIYRNLHSLENRENFQVDEESAVVGIYQLKLSELLQTIEVFGKEALNDFMNTIVKMVRPDADFQWEYELGARWKGTSLKNRQDQVSLDLSLPKIRAVKEEFRQLPGEILGTAFFQEMLPSFNPQQSYATWLGEDRYEMHDGEHLVRIDANPQANFYDYLGSRGIKTGDHTSPKIEKKWGNRWYQLIKDEVVNERAISWKEGKRAPDTDDWSVIPGYRNWVFKKDMNIDGISSPEAYQKKSGVDWSEWDKMPDAEVLAFDPKDHRLYAVSRILGEKTIVQKVNYESGQAEIDGTTLSRLRPDSSYGFLARIENPRFIWFWQKETSTESLTLGKKENVLQKVELPRFGISFDLKYKNEENQVPRLVSSELQGYALAVRQELPPGSDQWGEFPHFVVLEKEDKIRIAVPRMNFKSYLSGLSVNYDLDLFSRTSEEIAQKPEAIHEYARESQKLFVWPINGHPFHLPEVEDRSYLALIHLWGRSLEYPSYDRARELLYGSRSNQGDFRRSPHSTHVSGAREVLEWIFSFKNNDYDPRALALRLGAALLIVENDFAYHHYGTIPEKTPELESSEFMVSHWKNLDAIYGHYLKVRDKISSRFFPEDLEKLFLKVRKDFPDFPQQYDARLAEIQGEDSGEVQLLHGIEPANFKYSIDYSGYYGYKRKIEKYLEARCSILEDSVNFYKSDNILRFPESFKALYSLSLRIDELQTVQQKSEVESLLKSQLERMLGVSVEHLNKLTNEQLKEEYLSLLRLYLRQGTVMVKAENEINDLKEGRSQDGSSLDKTCHSMVEFLYILANANDNKNRQNMKRWTLKDGFLNMDDWNSYNNFWNDSPDEQKKYEPERKQRDQCLFEFLPSMSSEKWDFLKNQAIAPSFWTGNTQAHRARHWDPRTEAIPSGFKKAYEQDNHTADSDDPGKRPVISVGNLMRFLKENDLNLDQKEQIQSTAKELSGILDLESMQDAFIRKKLEDQRLLIESSAKSDLNHKKVYEWVGTKATAISGLQAYRPLLLTLKKKFQDRRVALEEEIMKTIQLLPEGAWESVRELLFRESAVEARPSLKEVLQIYANGSVEKIFQMNPGLTEDQGKKLLQDTTSYLIASTYVFRVEEVIQALDRLLNVKDVGNEEMQQFYQNATSSRTYDIAEHPDYLVFEYWSHILIRKDQMDNLQQLTSEKTTLLEMIMGAGKTSVLLPLVSHANASPGEKLSMVVLPEALVASMSKQLSDQLDLIYGQGIDLITVHRRHKYDLQKIQYLYSRIRKDLDTARVIVTSNSSIQSLFLIFIELIYNYEKLDHTQKTIRGEQIEALQKIFHILKKYSHVLIDEVDSILDIMASHRFSIGHHHRLEKSIVNATAGLYRILAENQEIHQTVNIPFIQEEQVRAVPYSRDIYHQKVKDLLIEGFCDPQNAKYFFDEPELIQEFQAIGSDRLKQYLKWNSLKTSQKGLDGVEQDEININVVLEERKTYLDGLKYDEFKDVISVAFTQIHQILPLTLERAYLVHYGLCPKESEGACHPFVGIPYHSGAPVVNSRFGTDLESLNYTIQAHLESRDVLGMFELEMTRLKKQFIDNNSRKVRDKISSYFSKTLSDGQILNMDRTFIQSGAKHVQTRPDLMLELVKQHAAPKIEIFPDQLFTNSYIYPVLFKKIQGMTGTLWNADSFPKFYETLQASDSLGRTLTALWKSEKTRKVKVVDAPRAGEQIQSILDRMLTGTQPQSIIDQGGFLRGRDNQEVAEAMRSHFLGKDSEIDQLIFYDAKHQIQLMEAQAVRPYVKHETDRMKTGAYWDMQHTTGSDLKVHPQTAAVLTISKFSILRDLLQSAWRLRELDRDQSVTLMITRDDLQIMSKLLVEVHGNSQKMEEESGTVDFRKILLYLATNEAIRSAEVNYRSVKASQRALIVDQIYNTLLDPQVLKTKSYDFLRAFKQVKGFFSNPRGEHPYERYGIPMAEVETLPFLESEIDRILSPVQGAFENLSQLRETFRQDVSSRKDDLRSKILTALVVHVESDEEMEIETQQEQEQEMELEVVQDFESHSFDASYDKLAVNWNRDALFDGHCFNHPTTMETVIGGKDPRAIQSKSDLLIQFFLNPIISLGDLLKIGSFEYVRDLFDPRIHGSLNLFPVFLSDSEKLTTDGSSQAFTAFGIYQGKSDFILISLNKYGAVDALALMTRDEALDVVGNWLVEDFGGRGYSEGQQRSFLIYQFGNGFIRQSGNFLQNWNSRHEVLVQQSQELLNQEVSEEDLDAESCSGDVPMKFVDRPEARGDSYFNQSSYERQEVTLTEAFSELKQQSDFLKLLVQAKFLTGRTHFTDQERPFLEAWLRGSDERALMNFFTSEVLRFRDSTRENFEGSVLHDVFHREQELQGSDVLRQAG